MCRICEWILVSLVALGLMCIFCGCAANEASLEGHDFLQAGLINLQTALNEYRADDDERIHQVREGLAKGFTTDILRIAATGNEDKTKDTVDKFLAYINNLDAKAGIERRRYENASRTITSMRNVNDRLRDLTMIKLQWKSDAVEYIDKLRKEISDGRK